MSFDDNDDDTFAMLKRLIFESDDFATIVGMTDKGRTMARVYFELAETLNDPPVMFDWLGGDVDRDNPVSMVRYFEQATCWEFAYMWATVADEHGIGSGDDDPRTRVEFEKWLESEVKWWQLPNDPADPPSEWRHVVSDELLDEFRNAIGLALDLDVAGANKAYDAFETKRIRLEEKWDEWHAPMVQRWHDERAAAAAGIAASERLRAEDPEAAAGNGDLVWVELPEDYDGHTYSQKPPGWGNWSQSRYRGESVKEHYVVAKCPYCKWTPVLLRKAGWPQRCPNCTRSMFADIERRNKHYAEAAANKKRVDEAFAAELESRK